MKSLRGHVMVGATLWTIGLLAVWAIVITIYGPRHRSIVVVHSHPHALGAVAIAAMIAGFWIVRAGLRPFDAMRGRLAAVQSGNARQVEGRYPSEVQPLVKDLNALLAHQERAVSRAVAKAGDLAHGLKTPLAVLAQEAEQRAAAGETEVAAAILEQVDRMRRQIDYHLAQARAAASAAMPGAHCAVRESADGLARTMRRLHGDRRLTIDVRVAPEHSVRCERQDLDEMLGNVIDNACKWARQTVVISSRHLPGSRDEAAIEITVDDDGPGLPAAMRQTVLQRGVRADEAAPGWGIGLAIVRDLAALHNGSIVLDDAPGGGLRARLRLPVA